MRRSPSQQRSWLPGTRTLEPFSSSASGVTEVQVGGPPAHAWHPGPDLVGDQPASPCPQDGLTEPGGRSHDTKPISAHCSPEEAAMGHPWRQSTSRDPSRPWCSRRSLVRNHHEKAQDMSESVLPSTGSAAGVAVVSGNGSRVAARPAAAGARLRPPQPIQPGDQGRPGRLRAAGARPARRPRPRRVHGIRLPPLSLPEGDRKGGCRRRSSLMSRDVWVPTTHPPGSGGHPALVDEAALVALEGAASWRAVADPTVAEAPWGKPTP